MAEGWYLARNGQQYGPYSSAQFRQFAAEGRLSPSDMVASVGAQQWMHASAIPGLVFGASPPSQAVSTAVTEKAASSSTVSPLGAAAQLPSPQPRQPLDAAMGIAVVLSCIFWLFVGGAFFLTLTGIIWLVVGVRIAITGGIPDMRGRLHRRRHYRAVGVVLAVLGLLMSVGHLAMLIG
jgi:hypothetical protein